MLGAENVDTRNRSQVLLGHGRSHTPPNTKDCPAFWFTIIVRRRHLQHQTSSTRRNRRTMFQTGAVLFFDKDIKAFRIYLDQKCIWNLSKNQGQLIEWDVDCLTPSTFWFVINNQLSTSFTLTGVEMKENTFIVIVLVGQSNVDTETFGVGRRFVLDSNRIGTCSTSEIERTASVSKTSVKNNPQDHPVATSYRCHSQRLEGQSCPKWFRELLR